MNAESEAKLGFIIDENLDRAEHFITHNDKESDYAEGTAWDNWRLEYNNLEGIIKQMDAGNSFSDIEIEALKFKMDRLWEKVPKIDSKKSQIFHKKP